MITSYGLRKSSKNPSNSSKIMNNSINDYNTVGSHLVSRTVAFQEISN